MASTSAIATADGQISRGAPTVVQWVSSNGATQRIGTKHTHRVSAFLIAESSPDTVFFGLRALVGLKGTRAKTMIHVFVFPEHIARLTLRDPSLHPAPVLTALTGRIPGYESPEDIVGLTFSLERPATAIGPARATGLSPKTNASEDFLASLTSLVQATEMTWFIPKNKNPLDCIRSLCSQACNGGLKASPDEYSLHRLYGGSGGKDINDLLSHFREPSQGPPSYDELALSSPGPPPMRDTRRRKLLSSDRSSLSPPPSKKQTGDPPVSAAEVRLMRRELGKLAAEVAQLRVEALSRTKAASPPSEPHGEDRLGRVESAVSRFEERMRQVERALEQAGLLVLTGGGDEDDGHPVARVVDRDQALLDTFADQMGDMAADINTEVDDKLDEMLANVKDEVRGWAQDTYEELLETRLDELVEQRLADAVWTVSRCN